MSLTWFFATRFRNLTDTDLKLNSGINLFYGPNGSGKTSVLEAVYFLSSGRTFRSVYQDPIIQRGAEECIVRGDLIFERKRWQVGVSRSRLGRRNIRVNGEVCAQTSELARLLPTLLLGPESVDVLLGPPELRRRFLNWGLFHVEHGFANLWLEARRCLQQRNRLLRDNSFSKPSFSSWSMQLAVRAKKIDEHRAAYLDNYIPTFHAILSQLSDLKDVHIHYDRGWDDAEELLEIYEREADNDRKRGFTQKGFQRADVKIMISDQPATKVCSRGELKALVWSMLLAQGAANRNQNTLYLIDDLVSEFDEDHRRRIGGYLGRVKNQVLVTGVDKVALEDCCEDSNTLMFHVKHGQIKLGMS